MEELPRIKKKIDWQSIDATVNQVGGVVIESMFPSTEVAAFNREFDDFIHQNPDAGLPTSNSTTYNKFLGHHTIRFHGLAAKSPTAAAWLEHPFLVSWAERMMQPIAASVLMNAGELIQIAPGEPRQFLHRDSDSWPIAQIGHHPIIVNAIVALDPFTEQNGATRIAPGSHRWQPEQRAADDQIVRAIMNPGDALLFRGDVLHGGGANESDKPRRGVSISYCAGWLRTVENSQFNIPIETARTLSPTLQSLLGFRNYDGSAHDGGLLGLYENGDPAELLS